MKLGKVKWYNKKKKYGFIIDEDGEEFFVHLDNIITDRREILVSGENVNFEVEKRENGKWQAINVSSLDI